MVPLYSIYFFCNDFYSMCVYRKHKQKKYMYIGIMGGK